MATFIFRHPRKGIIFFTDHALDRWWERCEANGLHGRQDAMNLLRERLQDSIWKHALPSWARVSLWNRARAEGWLGLDDDSGFIVNRNDKKERIAVTYIDRVKTAPFPNRNAA